MLGIRKDPEESSGSGPTPIILTYEVDIARVFCSIKANKKLNFDYLSVSFISALIRIRNGEWGKGVNANII